MRRKSPNSGCTQPYPYRKIKNYKEIPEFYFSIFKDKPFTDNFEIIKDKVYILPYGLPNFEGLNVLRSGILLGEIKKNRIEPCHSAFMASKPEECVNAVNFSADSEEIHKFLHGEEIQVEHSLKGYTAVSVEGIVTGFGKASGGKLKNKYPKGLRNL